MTSNGDGDVGEVRIGAREIYDAVGDLRSRVDVALTGAEQTRATVEDHESRIRGIERWRYALPTTALVALASAAAAAAAVVAR